MLDIKNIKKAYTVGDIITRALDGVSISFKKTEFVAILGESGSGKTTFLNIVGGLDRYDSGELIIQGKKTKDFKEVDWDAYRNHLVGFIFQNYNLITHLSIVDNVELGMALAGLPKAKRHQKAISVLKRVGLAKHLHKKPNQLSGGQMQRVAIARALANEPKILLCDEPTGALDSTTSVQIMDLIKKIAKDHLVIMVTHNPNLAEKYADRIVRFKDGKIISDSRPAKGPYQEDDFKIKKTNMNFWVALKLSLNNIKTKKARTFLTALASSIGIIGIAVILSLSTGFQVKIDEFQGDAMSEFPIIISENQMQIDPETMREHNQKMFGDKKYIDSNELFLYDQKDASLAHRNILTDDFLDYINKIDPEIAGNLGFVRATSLNLVKETAGKFELINLQENLQALSSNLAGGKIDSSKMRGQVLSTYPSQTSATSRDYLQDNYELVAGEYPKSEFDLTLIIDTQNRLSSQTMAKLGFKTDGVDKINFAEIVGMEYKLIPNDVFYESTVRGGYRPGIDYRAMYQNEASRPLRITGIIRQSSDSTLSLLSEGLVYGDKLLQAVIAENKNSQIVQAQQKVNYNVLTLKELTSEEKDNFLAYLGGSSKPNQILIYPRSFNEKDKVTKYLEEYNQGKDLKDQIIHTDLALTISSLTRNIMDAITVVLVAFAGMSLVVSLIMISIITYISVLERTREIGVLKALGARKKDITRVFDAETFIIGLLSGVLGILVALVLTVPINKIIYQQTQLANVASLQILHAVGLIILSTTLTVLGGHIPALMASKKDAVEALRAE